MKNKTLDEVVEPGIFRALFCDVKYWIEENWREAIAGAATLAIMGGAYQCCFGTWRVENVTVVDFGSYEIPDSETLYGEVQTTVTVVDKDGDKKCFRSYGTFADNLCIGDELKFMDYRFGIVGPCKYAEEYETVGGKKWESHLIEW